MPGKSIGILKKDEACYIAISSHSLWGRGVYLGITTTNTDENEEISAVVIDNEARTVLSSEGSYLFGVDPGTNYTVIRRDPGTYALISIIKILEREMETLKKERLEDLETVRENSYKQALFDTIDRLASRGLFFDDILNTPNRPNENKEKSNNVTSAPLQLMVSNKNS